MTTPTPPIALTVKAAAQATGLSESYLHHSDIPRVRAGRRVLFLVTDLLAYLEARRTHAA